MKENLLKKKAQRRNNFPQLTYSEDASLSHQTIEKIINDKKRFELRGDSIALQLHEHCASDPEINLLTHPMESSQLFPAPGILKANTFGEKSNK